MPLMECPSRNDLSRFNLGRLPDQSVDDIAAHLEECNRCEQAVKEFDGEADPIVTGLRGLAPIVGQGGTTSGPLPLPYRLGDYEVLSELGRRSMGIVYLARHTRLQRVVALKMLLGGEFARDDIRARFNLEAKAVARLQHPNIIQIFEVGEWCVSAVGPPVPYCTLEHVEGGSLSAPPGRSASGPAPCRELAPDTGPRYSLRSRPGHRAPGPEAIQRVVDRGWSSQNLRFRRGQVPDSLNGRDAGRPLDRDAGVHGTRTSRRRRPARSTGFGRLRAGRDFVHDAHGPSRVSGTVGPRNFGTGEAARAAFTAPAAAGDPERPGDDLPEMPGEGSPAALLECGGPGRRFGAILEWSDAPGPAGRDRRAGWKWARRRRALIFMSVAMALLTIASFVVIVWQWQRAESKAIAEAAANAAAQKHRIEVVQNQAELALDQALGLCDRAEVGYGLLWLAKSMELAEGVGLHDLDRATRINLAEWSGQRIRTLWTNRHHAPVLDLAFSSDGPNPGLGG